jgi:ParB family chromosome partitioning protein
VVNAKGNLVAGLRRLHAVRKLGWKTVPVIIAKNLDDARSLLRAEHDENTCRKDFTPSEAVAIAEALSALEKEAAKERQRATRAKKGEKIGSQKPASQGGENSPLPSQKRDKSRDRIAAAVGRSAPTLKKAAEIVKAANAAPDLFGDLLRQMDATGKVDPAFKQLGQRRAAQEPPKPAPEGAASDSMPAEPVSAPASPPTATADADGGLYSDRLGSALSKVAGELSWITPLPDGGLDATLAQSDKWDWSQVQGSTLPQLRELIRNLQDVCERLDTAAAGACGGGMGVTA